MGVGQPCRHRKGHGGTDGATEKGAGRTPWGIASGTGEDSTPERERHDKGTDASAVMLLTDEAMQG